MADIASLAIRLTANPTGFEAGLVSAQQYAQRFASSTLATFQNLGRNLGSMTAAMGANPLGLAALAAGGLAQAAGQVREILASVTAELQALTAEGMRAAAAQAGLSRRFGLTATAAGGLLHEANLLGVGHDDLRSSMQAFSVRLGESAHGAGAAQHALRALGLDARELAAVPLDEALGQIGDALNRVENAGLRNSLRFQILGRRAAELEPILSRGSAGIRAAADQAERWGLTFSVVDAAAIRSAQLAVREADVALGSVRQGFANALAAAAAPGIELLARLRTGLLDAFQPLLGDVRAWLRDVGSGLQTAAAAFRAEWERLRPTVDACVRSLREAFAEFRAALGTSQENRRTWEVIGRMLAYGVVANVRLFTALLTQALFIARLLAAQMRLVADAAQFMANPFGGGAAAAPAPALPLLPASRQELGAFFGFGREDREQTERALEMTADALDHLGREARNVGLDEFQRQLLDLRLAGASAGQINAVAEAIFQVRDARQRLASDNFVNRMRQDMTVLQLANDGVVRGSRELEAIRAGMHGEFFGPLAAAAQDAARQADMLERANQLIGGLRTPLDAYQASMRDINALWEAQLLTADQAAQAAAQAADQLERASNTHPAQLAQGFQAGSAQAISLINSAVLQQSADPIERVRQVAEQQRQIQAEHLRVGRQLLDEQRNNQVRVVQF